MGTYLQGVQSIIPSLQPADNGLNVVANLLQLKQSQYDSNYKSLNKLYGQYYYADLTRKDNIEKRDNTVKQIDFDLKRIAGLDLSLEQNVTQAMQVFKPFYEDTALMKDMAWTKNFSMQLGEAEGLSKSMDVDRRKLYWEEGVQALQYKRKEFMDASAGEAMSFENPIYTPYVNVQTKSAEIFKDSGISMDITDTDGKYIIRQKNGDILTEPLSKLLQSQLSADPGVRAVYDTKAYVNRKQWTAAHAQEYGGEKQAEMKYLEDAYGKMKKATEERHADYQDSSKAYDAKIEDIKKQINAKGGDPILEKQLRQYESNKQINDGILTDLSKQVEQFNGAYSSSGNTSTGFKNPYSDINSLRYVVDSSMANDFFADDVMTAAKDLSKREMVRDIKADPFAIIEMRHANRMAEINKQAYFDKYDYDGQLKTKKSSGGKKTNDPNNTTADDNSSNPFNPIVPNIAPNPTPNPNTTPNTTPNTGNNNTPVKKDSWGRSETSEWYGWDPDQGKYTQGPNKGKNKLPVKKGVSW
jgi:Tfp pilus assembly major pilin PilA